MIACNRYTEVNISKIRYQKYEDAKISLIIMGYNTNVLYLYLAGENVPCGKDKYKELSSPCDPKLISWM